MSKSTNEYYQKIIQKNGHKMDLYPAMGVIINYINILHIFGSDEKQQDQ